MAENLDIVVNERGAREVQRNIAGIGAAAIKASGPMRQLQALLASYVSLQALRNLSRLADQYTEMENRVRVLDGVSGDYNNTLRRLYDISQETRSSLRDNVLLFQRMGLAQKELNASSEELFQVTRAVGQAIAIQGGLATTSAGAVLQLSQAFGSGRVQLEEFNSVITGIYPIAKAAADGIDAAGGSIAKLRKLIADGAIDSRTLFQGILKSIASLDEQFLKTTPTVAQAFIIFRNALLTTVGDFNNATGASDAFARALIGLAGNLNEIILGVSVLVAASLPLLIAKITVEVLKLAKAIKVLMFTNPITALLSLASGALAYFVLFNDELDKIDSKTGKYVSAVDKLGAAWTGTLAYVKAAWADLPRWLGEIIDSAVTIAVTKLSTLGSFLADVLGTEEGSHLNNVLKGLDFTVPPDALKRLETNGQDAAKAFYDAYQGYLTDAQRRRNALDKGDPNARPGSDADPVNAKAIEKLKRQLDSLKKSIDPVAAAWIEWGKAQDIIERSLSAGLITLDQYNELLGQAYRHFEDSLSPLGEFNKEMEQQIILLQLSTDARERQLEIFSIQEKLSRNLTDAERASVISTMQYVQQLSALREVIDEIVVPQENFIKKIKAVNQAFDQGYLNNSQYVSKLRDLRLELLQTQTDVESGFERGLLQIGKQFTDTSILIEDSMVNAFKSAEDAFVQFVTTGKASFSDLVNSILEDLVRLAIRQSITGPLAGALGGIFGSVFSPTSAVSQVGSVGSGMTAASWMPGRAVGGHTAPNSMFRVNESGIPEVWSDGSKDYLMTGSTSGRVYPLQDAGNSGIVVVQPRVIINNNAPGVQVSSSQKRGADGQPELEVLIQQVESGLASGISSGQSPLVPAIGNKFGISPQARGR